MLLYQIDKPDIARYNCKRVRRTRVYFVNCFRFITFLHLPTVLFIRYILLIYLTLFSLS